MTETSNTKYTKKDWLTPMKFAKKHNLSKENVSKAMNKLYLMGTKSETKSHTPVVIKDKLSHHSDALLANPEATDIIITKTKEMTK